MKPYKEPCSVILASKQDLEVMMAALVVYARAKETTAPHKEMAHDLAMGMRQLYQEAFKSCPLCHEPLYGDHQVVDNIHIGKVHLACVLLHALNNKPKTPLPKRQSRRPIK